jgi:undecaprenyl-diphosphatase
MELLKAILLGIIQGQTEFLPISSSGHLVIGSALLRFDDPGIAFEVFLHLGTLVSVVIAFRAELAMMLRSLFTPSSVRRQDPELERSFRWILYVMLATLPAVAAGLWLKDSIEAIFSNILITFTMLSITGVIMVLTPLLKDRAVPINCPRSILIGVAQACAIMPGLSRSGSTIFTGMLLGINRETAARFSFIMSIPAILGAATLKGGDLLADSPGREELVNLLAGTVASAISGYLAIIFLMAVVRRGKLQWFGYYCFLVSAIGVSWYFLVR